MQVCVVIESATELLFRWYVSQASLEVSYEQVIPLQKTTHPFSVAYRFILSHAFNQKKLLQKAQVILVVQDRRCFQQSVECTDQEPEVSSQPFFSSVQLNSSRTVYSYFLHPAVFLQYQLLLASYSLFLFGALSYLHAALSAEPLIAEKILQKSSRFKGSGEQFLKEYISSEQRLRSVLLKGAWNYSSLIKL